MGLKTIPKGYVDLDLEAISSSDQHDSGVLTYGPDEAGCEWNIRRSRKLNWKMQHSCQVEGTKRQVGGELEAGLKKQKLISSRCLPWPPRGARARARSVLRARG